MVTSIPSDLLSSTAFDIDHPPTNVNDNDETTFWMTTGLFPHEIVLQFRKPAQITRVMTITGKVRNMIVFAALDKDLTDWNQIDTTNLPEQPVKQQEIHQLNYQRPSYGIRLVISKGWGPFAAVYLIRIDGPTLSDQDLAL
jgi:heat shock protein beta-11